VAGDPLRTVVVAVLNLVVLERAAAARRCELAMAARLRELEVRAALGLKLGRLVRLGLVGFELAGVVVHAEAVFEVEAGGVARFEAGRRRRLRRKTTRRHLSRVRVAEGGGCWR